MADCKRSAYTLEIKSMQADGTFAGYASVFHMVDSQRDIVRPGAFAESLKKRKHPLQLLWQHQWESPIGVIAQIFEDKHGLYVEGKLLLDVARAREAYVLLKAGAIRGLSIGFTVQKAKRNIDAGTRELLAVDLWEVSLVTLPANEAAQVTVVKLQALAKEHAALDKVEKALAEMRKTLANGHAMPIGWEKTKRITDQFFIKAAAADDSETWNGEDDDGDGDEDDGVAIETLNDAAGNPIIDPNTNQPYPLPPTLNIDANVQTARDATWLNMYHWFKHFGEMDYQRSSGKFEGPFRNVTNYN